MLARAGRLDTWNLLGKKTVSPPGASGTGVLPEMSVDNIELPDPFSTALWLRVEHKGHNLYEGTGGDHGEQLPEKQTCPSRSFEDLALLQQDARRTWEAWPYLGAVISTRPHAVLLWQPKSLPATGNARGLVAHTLTLTGWTCLAQGNEELLPGPPSQKNMNNMPRSAAELPTLSASREGRETGHGPGPPMGGEAGSDPERARGSRSALQPTGCVTLGLQVKVKTDESLRLKRLMFSLQIQMPSWVIISRYTLGTRSPLQRPDIDCPYDPVLPVGSSHHLPLRIKRVWRPRPALPLPHSPSREGVRTGTVLIGQALHC
ncbi:hypothetical protein R6Z07F_017275 [Ovis aries]